MKKKIFLSLACASLLSIVLITGCKKDDTSAPVISVTGGTSMTISLNSTYTDAGATATDDKDGSVTVTSDESSTNPNVNRVGTYTINYTATDAAGNVGTATRTVIVKNDAEAFVGNYTCTEMAGTVTFTPYSQSIYVDSTINNKIHFTLFANYANNTTVIALMQPDGSLNIPSQTTPNDIGTDHGGSCDVIPHTFSSTSTNAYFSNGSAGFTINYIDADAGGGSCTGNTVVNAIYARQ